MKEDRNEGMDCWINEWMNELACINGGWMGRCMGGWLSEWKDELENEWIRPKDEQKTLMT